MVVSAVCCAWLIRAWADCTSLVIEVMPLPAAWIVLMPFDIEFEQVAQVARPVGQALCREEVDRIVERRVDPLARRKLGLGGRDQVRGLLQLQKVLPDAGCKNDISHRSTFLVQSPTWDLHVTIPTGSGKVHRIPGVMRRKRTWLMVSGHRMLSKR